MKLRCFLKLNVEFGSYWKTIFVIPVGMGVKQMTEKKSSFPNVSLGGKLNKQKSEKYAGNLRYREKDESDSITKK